MSEHWDAVVVGSGPNGLAAALTFARAGRSVLVLEANATPGGAVRSAELTLPGFVHDVGSAIHPLAVASPFLRSIDLEAHGLRWITPEAAVAHPLDGRPAAITWNDLERTVAGLGRDGPAYRRVHRPFVERVDDLLAFVLAPVLRLPRHPLLAARFGLQAVLPATWFTRWHYDDVPAAAMFAGHAAHAVLPLSHPFTASFGLLFAATAHTTGWPMPEGGAQAITTAMLRALAHAGGEVRCGHPVTSLEDVPPSDVVLFTQPPAQVAAIAGDLLPPGWHRRAARFPHGPAALKVDWALSEPIPWADPDVARAGTVHLGGTIEEIARGEAAVAAGRAAERPFVLLAQHTNFDPSRAPDGQHTAWAYCHVPNGYDRDVSEVIDRQVERFAPGFRDTILARTVTTPRDLEAGNANLVGGDFGGGSYGGLRTALRPWPTLRPYRTPDRRLWVGSASTPPGAGVHGMAGHNAATAALRATATRP